MQQRRRLKRVWRRPLLLTVTILCGGIIANGVANGTSGRGADLRILAPAPLLAASPLASMADPQDCVNPIIPVDGCYTGSDGSGGGGDPNDVNGTQGTVWPSSFGVWGSYQGVYYVGAATRLGNTNNYAFSAIGTDGSTITGHVSLSIGEALLIDVGVPITLTSWSVDTYSY